MENDRPMATITRIAMAVSLFLVACAHHPAAPVSLTRTSGSPIRDQRASVVSRRAGLPTRLEAHPVPAQQKPAWEPCDGCQGKPFHWNREFVWEVVNESERDANAHALVDAAIGACASIGCPSGTST